MPEPIIVFNNSTGSDTAASGAGPATAVTGTAAAHTNGSASTTITLTNSPDLSGVATDGSACLWLKTSSGRQFSKITGADNSAKTVTVADSFTIALASAVNYAIGGKRATLNHADSLTLFGSTGFKGGWTVEIEHTGTDYTYTGTMSGSGSSATLPITVRSSSATRPILTFNSNGSILTLGTDVFFHVNHLHFKFGASASTAQSLLVLGTGFQGVIEDCLFDGAAKDAQGIRLASNPPTYGVLIRRCGFANMGSSGFGVRVTSDGGKGYGIAIVDCDFDGCGTCITLGSVNGTYVGFNLLRNSVRGIDILNTSNGGRGHVLVNNTIDEMTQDGIRCQYAAISACVIANNQITNCDVYGLNFTSGFVQAFNFIDYNNLHGNGTARLNVSAGAHDTALAPGYVNAAGDNYAVGTNAKAVGYPASADPIGINSATYAFVDIGAAQREEAGASGGLLRHPGMGGGIEG